MAGMSTSLFQAAWMVNDLERSIQQWVMSAPVGPFFVIPHAKVERVLYRGAPATLDFSAALAQAGPIQIELIQQHNDVPSAYRDVVSKGREGFHHVCTMTDAFDSEMRRYGSQGVVPVTQGAFGDIRFAYESRSGDAACNAGEPLQRRLQVPPADYIEVVTLRVRCGGPA